MKITLPNRLRKFLGKPYQMVGRVEGWEFTSGSIGNQWTTIDGARFATFWNMYSKDWTKGDLVTFTVYRETMFGPRWWDVDFAKDITKVPD